MQITYDIIVIGFGKAGKTLALKSANLGKKVALIEQNSSMYGGTCINIGCIPTKKLIQLAKNAKFHDDKLSYFENAMSQKENLIKALRAKNFDMLNSHENITIINGKASFVDENTILVTNHESKMIVAKTIIINTGSLDKKLEFENIIYSKEALSLKTLPKSIAIIGSGFIGLEFASMFASFGSKVSLILRKNSCLKNEENELSQSVENMLKAQGVDIYFNSNIKDISKNKIKLLHQDELKNIEVECILGAIGREANTKNLKLEKADIKTDEKGNIIVNEFLQTNHSHIYAVGDVKGGELFTYISLDDFRIVFDNLFGKKQRNTNNRSTHANVLFTAIPFAKVGFDELKMKNKKLKTLSLSVSNIPMAKILANDFGVLKAVVDEQSGEILGVNMHCEFANEVINELAIAINLKATAHDLKNQIFTHPSMSEALNDLFGQF